MANSRPTPGGSADDQEPAAKRQKTADAAASPTHAASATTPKSGPGLNLDTTITTINPDGDLVLDLGSRSALRVSSSVLKLASPVFRTMLGPHFSEGQNIKVASAANPMVLPLPDTHFGAMRIICETLHFREPLGTPIHETLREIATLVDYYDLASSMRLQSEAWLKNSVEVMQKFDYGMFVSTNAGLIYCARMLDAPEAFRIITKDCILRYVGTFLQFKDADDSTDTDILASVVSSYKHWQSMRSYEDFNKHGTNFDYRLKDWLRNTSLCSYCVLSEEFANYLRSDLTYAVEYAFKNIDGLCLDCVRNDRKPLSRKECRIPHDTESEDDGINSDYEDSDEW
ncbi:hypothetical protein GTA08_BOTSDO05869 [Neofusicoccum parvum]|uniref:Uncharacterized protein n=1 Tax=Neofusicoccum parvum TaxID=310453 RepID=A0ACB5S683_9PEZI|nr:hypothetical protein GTA08_BOTSDO05869 [Neofusicoccum parvum]